VPIGNYSELIEAAEGWLDNASLTTRIPDFITLCDAGIGRRLRLQDQVTVADLPVTAGVAPAPADFAEAISLSTKTDRPRHLDFLPPRRFWDASAETGSTGEAYTYTGDTVRVSPPVTEVLRLVYYAVPPRITAGTPTSWLLTAAPDLYLYGTLVHSAPYLRDDERIGTWNAGYERAVAELEQADERARFSGAALVARPRRSF
jgi:hypothetical protein